MSVAHATDCITRAACKRAKVGRGCRRKHWSFLERSVSKSKVPAARAHCGTVVVCDATVVVWSGAGDQRSVLLVASPFRDFSRAQQCMQWRGSPAANLGGTLLRLPLKVPVASAAYEGNLFAVLISCVLVWQLIHNTKCVVNNKGVVAPGTYSSIRWFEVAFECWQKGQARHDALDQTACTVLAWTPSSDTD
jgi:hypothetical protein